MSRSAVLILADGLGASYLGPYGNSWLPTPALNRFASRGLLFEFPWVDSDDPARVFRSILTGEHAVRQGLPAAPDLTGACTSANVSTCLLADGRSFPGGDWLRKFATSTILELPPASRPAAEIESTQMASFFAQAADLVSQLPDPFLLVVSTQGLTRCWDAPEDLRRRLADDSDPDPFGGVEPEQRWADGELDPDELLSILQAYAAQVAVLDASLDLLFQALFARVDRDEILTLVTALRGYPLGEHGRIGPHAAPLHPELLHVPMLIHAPSHYEPGTRILTSAQPADACGIAADWLGLPDFHRDESAFTRELTSGDCQRDLAVICSVREMGIRSPRWYLRVPVGETEAWSPELPSGAELFLQPDDRWNINNVVRRCPQIAEELWQQLLEFRSRSLEGPRTAAPDLPAILCTGYD